MRDLTSLLASAASVGASMKAADDSAKARSADKKSAVGEARRDSEIASRETSGFGTGLFVGLSRVGALFAAEFNDPDSREARDAADACARSFMASFTGATDKTAKGGTSAGYAKAIRLGTKTESVRYAMQYRLLHWYDRLDSADTLEPAEAKAAREEARRFTTVCGDAPLPNGDWPTDNKGQRKRPKFNGRPARTVRGINIPFGRGTDRKAQFAAMLEMFETHGDSAIQSDVLDAFLDNGGKFVDPNADSAESHAANALASVEKLCLAGGSTSADAAILSLAITVLNRISREGLAQSVAAPEEDTRERSPDVVKPGDETQDDSGTAEESGEAPQGEAQDAAEGILAAEEPAPAPEGAPVVLGAPTGRPSRRKGKGVASA